MNWEVKIEKKFGKKLMGNGTRGLCTERKRTMEKVVKSERLTDRLWNLIENPITQVMGAIVADAIQAHTTGNYESICPETAYLGTTNQNGMVVSKWGYKPYSDHHKHLARKIVHYHFEIRESESELFITLVNN